MVSMTARHRVREQRDRAGLTQADLAQRAGLTRRTVITIEADPEYRPRMDVAIRLAEALGLEFAELWQIERASGG
jgi:DNA-binding XRE family transcriptional regulator